MKKADVNSDGTIDFDEFKVDIFLQTWAACRTSASFSDFRVSKRIHAKEVDRYNMYENFCGGRSKIAILEDFRRPEGNAAFPSGRFHDFK